MKEVPYDTQLLAKRVDCNNPYMSSEGVSMYESKLSDNASC